MSSLADLILINQKPRFLILERDHFTTMSLEERNFNVANLEVILGAMSERFPAGITGCPSFTSTSPHFPGTSDEFTYLMNCDCELAS
ncbi:MAG: hypothetical protein DRJ40_03365 [Thermoprotei archaeon]|nr:MAG: hypothetical protein DRJ40_03365 [Thermoprotei archaeon]